MHTYDYAHQSKTGRYQASGKLLQVPRQPKKDTKDAPAPARKNTP